VRRWIGTVDQKGHQLMSSDEPEQQTATPAHPSRFMPTTSVTGLGGVEVRAMRAGRRQLAERLLIEAYTIVVPTTVLFAILLGPARAVEPRLYLPAAGIAVLIAVVQALRLLLLRRWRRRVADPLLTHHGIRGCGDEDRTIAWTTVAAIGVSQTPLGGRRLRVTLHDGARTVLARPSGAVWLPDPAFAQDAANAHVFAVRHQVAAASVRRRRWPTRALGVGAVAFAVVVAGWTTVRVADRHVVWPGQPTAAAIPQACAVLQTAGLNRLWPQYTRTRTDTGEPTDVAGVAWTSSTCTWWARPSHAAPQAAPSQRPQVRLLRYHSSLLSSGVGAAIDHLHATRTGQALSGRPEDRPRGLRLAGADDAFAAGQPGGVQVTARRANVRLEVTVDCLDDDRGEGLARTLAASILPHITLH
jgi:hypothetical protein